MGRTPWQVTAYDCWWAASGRWDRDDINVRCARERPLKDGDRLTEISLKQSPKPQGLLCSVHGR